MTMEFVIACDKREAFAQGSESDDLSAVAQRAKAEAIHSLSSSRTPFYFAWGCFRDFASGPSAQWIASRSLSSGAHSRDPLARNDDRGPDPALLHKRSRRRQMQRKGIDLVAGARIDLAHDRIVAGDEAIGMAGELFHDLPAL